MISFLQCIIFEPISYSEFILRHEYFPKPIGLEFEQN